MRKTGFTLQRLRQILPSDAAISISMACSKPGFPWFPSEATALST